MKDKNLIERYDDNPGEYFGMLVESFEDKEDKKELKEDHISSWKDALHKNYVSDVSGETYPSTVEEASKKEIKWFKSKVENFRKAYDEFLDALYEIKTFDSNDVLVGGYVDENETPYPFDLSFDEIEIGSWLRSVEENCDALYEEALNESLKEQKEVTRDEKIKAISSNPEARKQAKELTDKGELPFNSIVDFVYADFFGKDESLKEDKFVPQDKMSKKAQKELNDKKRNTWGNTSPVTKVQPNKKAYDRKRDKKVVDEALNIGYWSADSWGSDYPPDNWEEVVSRANEMIKNKYLQTRDEEATRDYSSRLWDGYCRRARQLEKQRDKKSTNEAKESFSSLSKLADRVEQLKNVSSAYEDNGIIKIKCKWRKSEKQARNDYVDVNASLKKLLGDKYKITFDKVDSRDGGKEFSAVLLLKTTL